MKKMKRLAVVLSATIMEVSTFTMTAEAMAPRPYGTMGGKYGDISFDWDRKDNSWKNKKIAYLTYQGVEILSVYGNYFDNTFTDKVQCYSVSPYDHYATINSKKKDSTDTIDGGTKAYTGKVSLKKWEAIFGGVAYVT